MKKNDGLKTCKSGFVWFLKKNVRDARKLTEGNGLMGEDRGR